MTSRPWLRRCWPTGCSSHTRSRATAARTWSGTRSPGSQPCEMNGTGESGSPRAPATAALGAAFLIAGLAFDLVGALACGVALLALALGAVLWVELASRGGRLEREPLPRRLEEGDPYPVRIRLRRTL